MIITTPGATTAQSLAAGSKTEYEWVIGANASLPPLSATTYIFRPSGLNVQPATYATLTYLTSPTGCYGSGNLTTTNITTTSADLNWTEYGPATQWEIEYGLGTSYTLGTGSRIVTSTNPHTLTLPANSIATQYSYFVRSICGPNDTSAWSQRSSFTLLPTCPVPTVGTATNITTTTADIDWVENGAATQWEIEYGLGTSYTLGTGSRIVTTTNPHTLTLPASSVATQYSYFVRSICGPNDTSAWSQRSNFTLLPTCPVPTVGTASNITTTSANLNWTENGAATQWEIEYGLGTSYTLGTGSRIVTSTNPHTLTLPASSVATQYSYFVRSICGPNDTSAWSQRSNFTLLPTCPVPTVGTASNITTTSANLNWTENGAATQWEIEYGLGTSYTLGTGSRIVTSTNPHSLAVTPATTYTYFVRSICGPNDTSAWSARSAAFVSACLPVTTLPWTENFDGLTSTGTTSFPPCWLKENGDWSTSPASTYNTSYSTPNHLRCAWAATNEHMWTPGFDLVANTSYDFSFQVAGDGWNGWTVDVLENMTQTSVGANQVGTTFTAPGIGSTAVQPYTRQTYTFVPTTTGTYYFALRVNQPSGSPWYIAFDDFKVELTPSCPAPSTVIANNPTTSSLDVSWTSNSSATMYQIEYAQGTSFTLGTGTRIGPASVTNPHTVTGLNQSMPYTFYVREICAVGDTSTWSSPATAFTSFPAVPPNDDCSTPVDISNGALYYGTNAGATQTLAACDATPTATDVWYSFTTGALAGVVSDSVNTSFTGSDVVVQMFSGACGSLTPVVPTAGTTFNTTTGCVDGPAAGMEWSTYNVAANTTYFIRVYAFNATTPGPFSIRITGAPLAIKLDKISAVNNGNANRVDWNTLSEERGDRFELERSVDGKNFTKIYEQRANGEASRYTYMDNNAVKGMNHYRLRMVAANGGITYSETVSAFVRSAGFEVEAFPNPVSHELTVKVSGVQGADATIQVTDVTGKVIKTVKMNGNVQAINMSGLANGIYLIKYVDNNHQQTVRITKQ